MSPLGKLIALLAVVATLIGMGAGWAHSEQAKGAALVLAKQEKARGDALDSLVKMDSLALLKSARQTQADSVARESAVRHTDLLARRTDTAAQRLQANLATAEQVARDTASNTAALRAALEAVVVQASVADSARTLERAAWRLERDSTTRLLATLRVEREASGKEAHDLRAERESLQRQLALLNGRVPSVTGRTLRVLAEVAGVGAAFYIGMQAGRHLP